MKQPTNYPLVVETQAEIRRTLDWLRNAIREKGWTQKKVQRRMGWGETYTWEILSGQKAIRLRHLLTILEVIGVKPREFYQELYRWPCQALSTSAAVNESEKEKSVNEDSRGEQADLLTQLGEERLKLEVLILMLINKGTITAAELAAAVEMSERQDGGGK